MIRARITGTGMSVPDSVVDNHLLSRCMSTSDEWIVKRTGISERRVSPDTYRMLLRMAEAPDKSALMRRALPRLAPVRLALDRLIPASMASTR